MSRADALQEAMRMAYLECIALGISDPAAIRQAIRDAVQAFKAANP